MVNKYYKLYVRKTIYGGKAWAFDCDWNGVIKDEKMLSGYHDMCDGTFANMRIVRPRDDYEMNCMLSQAFSVFRRVVEKGCGL